MKKFIALLMGVALVTPFAVGCEKTVEKKKVTTEDVKPDGTKVKTVDETKTTQNKDGDGGGSATTTNTKKVDVDR